MVTLEINSEASASGGFKIVHSTDALLTATPCNTHLCIYVSPARAEQVLGFAPQTFAIRINDDDPVAARIGEHLDEATRDGRINQPLFVETLCISLLMHVNARYLRSRVRQHPKGKLTPPQLVVVSEYIHARLGQNISLKDLCALVNLSRYHFTRLFKETLGTTPHRYILHSKVEYAKTLMTKRKGSILDAAYQLSFADHAHFTNTFRKLTGQTPRSFLNLEPDIEHIGT